MSIVIFAISLCGIMIGVAWIVWCDCFNAKHINLAFILTLVSLSISCVLYALAYEHDNLIEATVIGHNDTTTIFQEVNSEKIHKTNKYYEDDSPYLLDIENGDIVVVWRVDEGSLG